MDGIAEVSAPLPACSDKLSLGFNGRSLAFSIPGKAFQYPAVSGKLHGDFSVAAQKDRNLGPIPAGSYWIDPAQLWTAGPIRDWLARNTGPGRLAWSGWGEHRVTIHPLPFTQTFGRGGFFIHGGDHQGSGGCIHVTGAGMERFVGELKTALSGLPACSIPLTVTYP
jgi:hypothetical protein